MTYTKETQIGLNFKCQSTVLMLLMLIAIIFVVGSIEEEFRRKPNERNLITIGFKFCLAVFLGIG